jgi:hypothetical protein
VIAGWFSFFWIFVVFTWIYIDGYDFTPYHLCTFETKTFFAFTVYSSLVVEVVVATGAC